MTACVSSMLMALGSAVPVVAVAANTLGATPTLPTIGVATARTASDSAVNRWIAMECSFVVHRRIPGGSVRLSSKFRRGRLSDGCVAVVGPGVRVALIDRRN